MKKKLFVGLAIVMFLIIGTVLNASALTFYDGFEAQSLDPFWTDIRQENGTVTLSTDQAHSGSQSVKLNHQYASEHKWIWIDHDFSDIISGNVSVWFYDSRISGVYAFLSMYNSTVTYPESGSLFSLGIMDWDNNNYFACSPDANQIRTSVQRTLGWHEFKMTVGSTGSQLFIDDTLVNSHTGNYGFDTVQLIVFGPRYVSANYYFDDFSMTTTNPVPEPATMLLLCTGLIGMAGVMRRKIKR